MSTILAERTYERVLQLAPCLEDMAGSTCSHIAGQPLLHLIILEQTPYTTVVRLLQQARVGDAKVPSPEVELRVYHDLRVAEALCWRSRYGRGEWLAGMVHNKASLGDKRELNFFLWKWLGHCLALGHSLWPAAREEELNP
jgi:uncharacterized protein YqiB (DUF1249 family)